MAHPPHSTRSFMRDRSAPAAPGRPPGARRFPAHGMRRAPVTVALALLCALALTLTPAARGAAPAQAVGGDGHPGERDVIVHLFQWPWRSVARECTEVLGPKGFGAVQVSPPQEHVVLPGRGYPWWQDYQPVSYELTSRRGGRADFAAMVDACHAAGVEIYVDAVVNHMAGGASTGPGSGGSTYSQYSYPAVPYGHGDFHHCGRNGNDDIANWTDRWEVQHCELLDLSDLATESSYVRGQLSGYLADLMSLGVDGFRIDAAKHAPVADLAAVYSGAGGDPYVFQEVIEGGPGEISPTEYTGVGDVTEFRYGRTVGSAFASGNLAGLRQLPGQMLLGSGDAVVFIDNHDTQRNNAPLTYKDGDTYALAEAFLLAYPYGTPKIMSSFTFSEPEQGPPASSGGTTSQVTCGAGWACEHRWRTTANLVGFHNEVVGTGLNDWWSNGSNQVAFGRGSAGYVVFNRGGTLTRTFSTSLPAGTYCDVANGDPGGGACSGPTYTVDASGHFTATVPSNRVLALHTGARVPGGGTPPGCTQVDARFNVNAVTTLGQNVYVVGSIAELGGWDPAQAVPLSPDTYPLWSGTVQLPRGTTFAYKYIKREGGTVVWESDPNRSRTTPTDVCTVTYDETWR